MNIQPTFNTHNQNNLNSFFSTPSFSKNSTKKEATENQTKNTIQFSLKISHYVKMILLSLGIKEERIQPHRDFYEDFDFDILTHLNMIFLVEAYFSIFINDEEAEKINTIKELEQIIQKKLL
ncbi:acyl carrier protein [Bernardetia litoralis DSM 6794]|uniref:Acyl carrier protein n=1 Tax=Bernardetia litoralis (strain ATCC 23117 / DSM 6794 / NBRC 15988 / NCIMB 1366 / Fx l1 / Sio-4) TaxID=880071 RepID=I4AGE5_BERLS|nr:acyl carrier protein [Bernardetia litoralis]AFM03030.1 acyl carrier protein [Bernardetia litoralis DSM 6794]